MVKTRYFRFHINVGVYHITTLLLENRTESGVSNGYSVDVWSIAAVVLWHAFRRHRREDSIPTDKVSIADN